MAASAPPTKSCRVTVAHVCPWPSILTVSGFRVPSPNSRLRYAFFPSSAFACAPRRDTCAAAASIRPRRCIPLLRLPSIRHLAVGSWMSCPRQSPFPEASVIRTPLQFRRRESAGSAFRVNAPLFDPAARHRFSLCPSPPRLRTVLS